MFNIRKLNLSLLILAVVLTSCSRKPDSNTNATWEPPEEGTQSLAVEGIMVSRGFLVEKIQSTGVVEGIREAWVVSETEGLIKELHFKLGDYVRSDEVLLVIENDIAAQNRDLAQGQYRTAQLEFQASEQSRENGSISELQFSQVTDRLLAAKSAMVAAVDAYENTFLKAPFSGAVATRGSGLDVGNYLSRGVRVARIVDYSSFRSEISVGEGQILLIREGSVVEVKGKDGLTRNGRVSAVSAGSDGSTGSFTVVVEWAPMENDRLKSGMSVDIAIEVSGGVEKIIAPVTAVRYRGGESFVYVDSNGQAEPRLIDLGSRLGERIEVLSGLDAGEVIITSRLASITPGYPVIATVINRDEGTE